MNSLTLTWEIAQPLAGETFVFLPDSAVDPVALHVASVRLHSRQPSMVQFSILFEGPADPVHPQKTYRLHHAQLGDYEILIAPVRHTPQSTQYEACFSHVP